MNYLVGDQTYTVSHFDQSMYILGYIQRDSRIYLADKDVAVTSFALSLPVLEYQTLVLRDDMETAQELLPTIPADQLNKIARFLEGQGHKELALEVATDPEHKFELALGLGQLDTALELAREADVEHKWKTVGDAALAGVAGRRRTRVLYSCQGSWISPPALLLYFRPQWSFKTG